MKGRALGSALGALFILNFLVFAVIALVIGGGAVNGYAVGGPLFPAKSPRIS
jgi:hypothetical protein